MKRSKNITDTELAVLKFLWDHDSATARDIVESLYPRSTASEVGTVHSMLQRLEAKKFIKRDRTTHAHTFSATVTKANMAGFQLQNIANKLTDGSYAPFLTHLIEGDRLSPADLAELRSLLKRRRTPGGNK